MSERIKCCLIGVPDHQGVIHVGGRIGAIHGPLAFRRAFSRLKSRHPVTASIADHGDSTVTADIRQNHGAAEELIARSHGETGLSIVVGGSHDHGASHLAGIAQALNVKKARKLRLGCINIDAHLDLRKADPVITSGSPFYLAIESGVLDPKRFTEFGIQEHCNAPELWAYAAKKKISIVSMEKCRSGRAAAEFKRALTKLSASCDAIVISLDLDAAAEAFAPGVSAPQAEGFSGGEIVEFCEIAGANKKVVSLGIFELNPSHDRDDQTARLAATAAYHFLLKKLF